MPDTALAARAAASVPAPPRGRAGGRYEGGRPRGRAGAVRGRPGGPRQAPAAPHAAPTSFDKPRFDKPRFDKPGLDEPGASEWTAEIPRADEPAANPAGPTLTDMPVSGLFGKTAGEAPRTPETAEEPEPLERSRRRAPPGTGPLRPNPRHRT